MRAEELGHFLRSRRARLRPSDVGLPETSGRRTTGLRREEVAVLAGIGVSWLTRVEQGRANRVGRDVLEGLAEALRLGGAERTHLFTLADVPHPPPDVASGPAVASHILLVEGLQPNPAYILDPAWDLVCWNPAETALFPVLAQDDPRPNLLRLLLETPDLRSFMTDWPQEIDRLTREFRLHLSQYPNTAGHELAAELREGHGEFAEAWERHDVTVFSSQRRQFQHDRLGRLDFDHHRLALPDHPGWLAVIYTPAPDGPTSERFASLLG